MRTRTSCALAAVAGGILCCVLSFYRASDAAPPADNLPFANAVQQRMNMIAELKAIRELVKEQNSLLRAQNELLGAAAGINPMPNTPAKRPVR